MYEFLHCLKSSSEGIPCLKTAAGAGTIGAEHVVGTIDSGRGDLFIEWTALISYRLFILVSPIWHSIRMPWTTLIEGELTASDRTDILSAIAQLR